MWTWWVSRSRSAPVKRSSPNVAVHSSNGRFEVMMVALRQQFLDVSIAEREPQVEPGCVLDDQGRKAMTAIGELLHMVTLSRSLRLVSR